MGAVLAGAAARLLLRVITSGRPMVGWSRPIELPLVPDWRVLGVTAGVAVLAALVFALAPLLTGQAAPAAATRPVTRAGESSGQRRIGRLLVVAQVALSMVLLTAAAVFTNHLSSLRTTGLGFDKASVRLATLDPREAGSIARG